MASFPHRAVQSGTVAKGNGRQAISMRSRRSSPLASTKQIRPAFIVGLIYFFLITIYARLMVKTAMAIVSTPTTEPPITLRKYLALLLIVSISSTEN